jgi:hypothetical protein
MTGNRLPGAARQIWLVNHAAVVSNRRHEISAGNRCVTGCRIVVSVENIRLGKEKEFAASGPRYERPHQRNPSHVNHGDGVCQSSIERVQSFARDKDHRQRPTIATQRPRHRHERRRRPGTRRRHRRHHRRQNSEALSPGLLRGRKRNLDRPKRDASRSRKADVVNIV